jgi:hypothetical protein
MQKKADMDGITEDEAAAIPAEEVTAVAPNKAPVTDGVHARLEGIRNFETGMKEQNSKPTSEKLKSYLKANFLPYPFAIPEQQALNRKLYGKELTPDLVSQQVRGTASVNPLKSPPPNGMLKDMIDAAKNKWVLLRRKWNEMTPEQQKTAMALTALTMAGGAAAAYGLSGGSQADEQEEEIPQKSKRRALRPATA